MKIYYSLNKLVFLFPLCIFVLIPIDTFCNTNSNKILSQYKNRPDLIVHYFQQNPHLWMKNSKHKLSFSKALTDIGRYQESLGLGYQLLLKPLNFFYRGQNYFNIAKNYYALNNLNKSRYYLDKVISRNDQYYLFYYARLEEYDNNYPKSLQLYHKSLHHKFGKKYYIIQAYSRAIHKALIYYKNKDKNLFHQYLQIIKENPCLSQGKTKVIQNALIL